MRSNQPAVLAAAALAFLSFASHAAATRLLRFPNVWHDCVVFSYAGDLWTVGTRGGAAIRLTSNPALWRPTI
jgi:tricorn protease